MKSNSRLLSISGLSRSTSFAALAAGACLLGSASFAQAQAPKPAASGNDDIVVTAQFREQKLQDTPLAITAIGQWT